MKTGNFTIVYAEDDPDDVLLVKQAFEKYNKNISVIHKTNGDDLMNYLKGIKDKSSFPCLIILDINMPGVDGREALLRIRNSDVLKNIPVVLFTTSSSAKDKSFAYTWGAEFITKPLIYSELEDLAHMFINICDREIKNRA
ncbi:MAG: response regulator [Flavisolibacter sp.]